MDGKENKNFTGKARERREYPGLDVILANGRSLFTYYLFISSFEHLPSDNEQKETLKITCADYKVIIKGSNLLPIKNDLKVKAIDTLQEGEKYKNVEGKPSIVTSIKIND